MSDEHFGTWMTLNDGWKPSKHQGEDPSKGNQHGCSCLPFQVVPRSLYLERLDDLDQEPCSKALPDHSVFRMDTLGT